MLYEMNAPVNIGDIVDGWVMCFTIHHVFHNDSLGQEIFFKGVLNISAAEIVAKFVHLCEFFSIVPIVPKSPTFASTRWVKALR